MMNAVAPNNMTPLVVEVMPSGKRFRLFAPFTFVWDGVSIRVDAGFVTDLASIPTPFLLMAAVVAVIAGRHTGIDWLFWVGVAVVVLGALLPKLGRQNEAAVIHDAIYRGRYRVLNAVVPRRFTRAQADRIFFDGMVARNVASWKRHLMHWAVRIGGHWAWTGDRIETDESAVCVICGHTGTDIGLEYFRAVCDNVVACRNRIVMLRKPVVRPKHRGEYSGI